MTNFRIYSKLPLKFPQKSGFNHKASKFRLVAPHYAVFFHYWGGPPLVSRQVVFFANIAVLPAHKMTNFRIYSKLPPPISSKKRFQPQSIEISGCCTSVFCIFSLLWGHPPFISRQVGFFAKIPPLFLLL